MTEPGGARAPLFERLAAEHRRLDERFGHFLAAAAAADADAAREAIEEFDRELRLHTELEEREVYARRAGEKLAPRPDEDDAERLSREMLLEHVQVRELSGIVARLAKKGDLAGAVRLAGGLARRWDAHTTREEREVFGSGA